LNTAPTPIQNSDSSYHVSETNVKMNPSLGKRFFGEP
jgi:hypothetical protein